MARASPIPSCMVITILRFPRPFTVLPL
jgi:hypothetical protein